MSDELERNKALVRELTDEMWLKADPAAVPRYFAADYRHTDPLAPQVRTGAAPTPCSSPARTCGPRVRVAPAVIGRSQPAPPPPQDPTNTMITGRVRFRPDVAGRAPIR
jgi:hypothetical protein